MKVDSGTRRGVSPVVVAALLVFAFSPLASSGTVAPLTQFTNGTTADADEVNANFEAIRVAVNDNDQRLAGAESDVAALLARIDALESLGQPIVGVSFGFPSGLGEGPEYFCFLDRNQTSPLGTEAVMPRDGTIIGFTCRAIQAPAAGSVVQARLHVNGVDAGGTITFASSDGGVVKSDASEVSVTAGDLVTVRYSSAVVGSGSYQASVLFK